MKFVHDNFEYIPQEPGIEGMKKIIELAARTCYKTEDLIKDGTANKIINNVLIPRGHTSCLEFGTIYLYREMNMFEGQTWINKYLYDRYSRVRVSPIENTHKKGVWITTTFRTILQGEYKNPIDAIKNNFDKDWTEDLQWWSEPTEQHYKRICYRFVMDRVGSQSVMRHRGRFGISYGQESTRFINYHRDKFDNNITYVYPSKFYQLIDEWSESQDSLTGEKYDWLKKSSDEEKLNFLRCHDRGWCAYEDSLKKAEQEYMYLTGEEGWRPEDARGVLPLDVKTEFLMCAYPEDWDMFFFRRCDKHAHPHIQSIANKLYDDYLTRI